MSSKKVTTLSYIVFGIYIVLLVWLILFKLDTDFQNLPHIRSLNLVPYGDSLFINGHIGYSEIVYNILVFIPLGIYIQIFRPDWTLIKKIGTGLGLSLILEIVQYIFAIGASDITDVIGNTMGCTLGILICIFLANIFKKRYGTFVNIIGLILEILAIGLMIIIRIAN